MGMAGWTDAAARVDVKAPHGLECEVAGSAILLHEIDGTVFAMAATCPHHAAWLSQGHVARGHIFCPRHMGEFDIPTGRRIGGPACPDLGIYQVRIRDGRVEIQIEAK